MIYGHDDESVARQTGDISNGGERRSTIDSNAVRKETTNSFECT